MKAFAQAIGTEEEEEAIEQMKQFMRQPEDWVLQTLMSDEHYETHLQESQMDDAQWQSLHEEQKALLDQVQQKLREEKQVLTGQRNRKKTGRPSGDTRKNPAEVTGRA